ncbi:type III-B CRISPR-associated protein Cas10/Cmr2 [Chloroflexus sp.]|uniref:type III-B CRISPR-associated protein Cas10/Cmr2 n=1 Tax=Chloroflexus sp. TaxID=1904827 RepID=UPI0026127660|nr:type III-B CRISPR-associated protein Cas10/Cmr2 [uncultured Chloroflexus sp.]
MIRYLFLVTLGPVQEFIAAARRTRDLWFGSWLLSELARVAAQQIEQSDGARLIFPAALPASVAEANVANKILAIIATDPKTLGEHVVRAVQDRLMALWQDARGRIKGPINDEAAQAQIGDLPEVYWAAVELKDETDYVQARRKVEALMAARKATRDFAPVTWGSNTPKSSIDGLRESVIPESAYPKGRNDPQYQQKIDALYEQYKAGPAERLSGVDLFKRHAQPVELAFASTSDVAVRPVLHRVVRNDQAQARAAWEQYIETLESIARKRLGEERTARRHPIIDHYDGGLLLESRLHELISEASDRSEMRAQREKAGRALAELYRRWEAESPDPYYAILLADGDRMGATIDHQSTIDGHIELSRRLSKFAAQARSIVEEHEGSLVYAGGDDVLAFLPLHTLLRCAQELHRQFAAVINPAGVTVQFTDAEGHAPTLSVGIAIVHHLEPLSDALAMARAAERAAKAVAGKNALAITLSKRSGADVTVQGHWGELDQRLQQFTTMHRLDVLPDGAAFQLRDLVERLTPTFGQPTLPSEAAFAEAKRIIGRKQPRRGQDEKLADEIREALFAALNAHSGNGHALTTIRAVAEEMIVARLLARAADIAGMPLAGGEYANLDH